LLSVTVSAEVLELENSIWHGKRSPVVCLKRSF